MFICYREKWEEIILKCQQENGYTIVCSAVKKNELEQ